MIIVVVVVWTCDGHEFSELHVLKGGVFSRPHLCSTYLSNTTFLSAERRESDSFWITVCQMPREKLL